MNPKVPHRNDGEIWAMADAFRRELIPPEDQVPPIDPLYIAEVDLKLDVIPLDGLFADIGIDAAILPDLSAMYVDADSYIAWDARRPAWRENRLRFSVAHELGHLMMHGEEINRCEFSSLAEFKQWALDGAAGSSAEYQANEFAGRLLVPIDLLQRDFLNFTNRAESSLGSSWRTMPDVREYVAEQLAPRFGVNRQVIAKRFHKEGLWPESE
jgi:hypothetical protein